MICDVNFAAVCKYATFQFGTKTEVLIFGKRDFQRKLSPVILGERARIDG